MTSSSIAYETTACVAVEFTYSRWIRAQVGSTHENILLSSHGRSGYLFHDDLSKCTEKGSLVKAQVVHVATENNQLSVSLSDDLVAIKVTFHLPCPKTYALARLTH